MSSAYGWLPEAARTDRRHPPAAYEFLFEALEATRRHVARREQRQVRHVTGRQLLEGFCLLARERFGLMAKTVLECWGIRSTSDVGDMVFRLVETGDLEKTAEDKRSDFDNLFDLEQAVTEGYQIKLDDVRI